MFQPYFFVYLGKLELIRINLYKQCKLKVFKIYVYIFKSVNYRSRYLNTI